jgi:hypothetical protein
MNIINKLRARTSSARKSSAKQVERKKTRKVMADARLVAGTDVNENCDMVETDSNDS